MKPGPELDALIAEKVMGWMWCRINTEAYPASFVVQEPYRGRRFLVAREHVTDDSTSGYARATGAEPVVPTEAHVVPHYSTDIKEAWRVVRRIADSGTNTKRDFVLHFHPANEVDEEEGWQAEFVESCNDAMGSGCAEGDTAPHAICLAALRAMNVEVAE